MKKSTKIGIGVGVAFLALYLFNKNKASNSKDTTANNTPTPAGTPSKTASGTPSPAGTPSNGKTPIPVDFINYPNGGEPEKVSSKLRSINVRNTNVNMSIWTNPYDADEYFVKLDEIEYFKWRILPKLPLQISTAIMPKGMTLTTTTVSSVYQVWNVPFVVKGIGVVDGIIPVAYKMAEDFIGLANDTDKGKTTAIKIYT